jgi:hypothetical protein
MNEERKKILDMLSEGKISVDDAEKLMVAIEADTSSATTSDSLQEDPEPKQLKYLFVRVEPKTEDGEKVNIRIPIGLIKAGVKLASLMPKDVQTKVNDAMNEKGVDMNLDFKKLSSEDADGFFSILSELSIDIDNEKESVKIFCQ